MWNNIKMFPLFFAMNAKAAWRSLKEDERGLSGVVVAVMLILVAVLAVILIWGLLGDSIRNWWDDIIGNTDTITPNVT